ncbi:MAG: hypothetical protein J2P14_13845, partial [Acidothermales bacterium]|nr:hypothetical protein [Acidothermales bacterium]
MGGAIIYVVIIAVWGVVLVPRWLRKHDASTPADGATHVEPENAPGRVLARRRRRQADAAAPTEATDAADAAVERPAAAAR